jgi:hypothetical protein
MSSEKLIEALETYSNAILGFIVLQSLAFSYTYGTNPHFSCIVKTKQFLAEGLIVHFLFSTILACSAIVMMSKTMQRVASQHRDVLRRMYLAKIIAVLLFAGLPVVLLFLYGLESSVDYAACVAALKQG